MKIITSKENLILEIEKIKFQNKTIGFIPTMGALHQGHISLIKNSVLENDCTIASVFINPTQFNNSEDLMKYPRTLTSDSNMLEKAGCDILFAPSTDDIYNKEELDTPFCFDFKGLDKPMEGKFRPNHFNGVVQIVSKLFTMVQPNRAYFGEKDFQQLAIIRLMTKSYNLPIEIISCQIIREASGLAMSSRNALLSDRHKDIASHIYAVLSESVQFAPNVSVGELKECSILAIEKKTELKVEYFEIIDGDTLKQINNWEDSSYIMGCIAVYCNNVRLIDNICYKKENKFYNKK